jgi:hypothetical protein
MVVAVRDELDRLIGPLADAADDRLCVPREQLAVEYHDAIGCDRVDRVDVECVVGRRVHVDIAA